jgi:sulfide dehydrogenase [flavocytochrome c] flavoprotein chain
MPKSGFSANSQAKVAAMAIRGELTGSRVFPARYANTCWSLIATDDGVKVGASLRADRGKDRQRSPASSARPARMQGSALRKQTYEESPSTA